MRGTGARPLAESGAQRLSPYHECAAAPSVSSAMVLIFEGADLAGKSTLARHYSDALRLPVVKIRWEGRDERAETIAIAKATVGLLAATRAGVILDRSFVSMWAYTRDADDYVRPIISTLQYVPDLHLIVLTMGRSALHRRYRKRPDQYFSESRLQTIDQRFAELPALIGSTLHLLHLDTGTLSPDLCRERIDQHLGRRTGPWHPDGRRGRQEITIAIGEIPVTITLPRQG